MNRLDRLPLSRLALLGSALLAMEAAQAAATPEQLAAIKLYGDVSIAEDRVEQWGPWEQFEPPAAGPLGFVAANLQLQREAYRPLPTTTGTSAPVTPPETPDVIARLCTAGSLCGYGADGLISGDPRETSTLLQQITIQDGVSIRLDSLPDGASETTPLLAILQGAPNALYGSPDLQVMALVTRSSEDDIPLDGQAVAPNFLLSSYVQGGESAGQRQVVGVVGRVTSTSDMAALRTSNRTATYVGGDLHVPTGTRGVVNMTVDFGQGTFSYATQGGLQTYQAQGVVRGSGYVATGFATAGTSGTLQGNFVGRNAAGTVGGASVTQGGVTHTTLHVTTQVVPQ
jgi:hypothetical protein